MKYNVKASTQPVSVTVDIDIKDLLRLLKDLFYKKYKISSNLKIVNGMLQKYECTSYHNNDWEYVDDRPATSEELEAFALWKQIEGLFSE